MRNQGKIDRMVRIAFGLGLIAMVFVGLQSAWGWLGLVPLLAGVVGFCPLYRLIGVDTVRR